MFIFTYTRNYVILVKRFTVEIRMQITIEIVLFAIIVTVIVSVNCCVSDFLNLLIKRTAKCSQTNKN